MGGGWHGIAQIHYEALVPAYIPTVICATCNKTLPYGAATVMRVHSKDERYIRVRCHGQEQKIGFADQPQQTVTLWQRSTDGKSS